jgi:hypothetical protein
MSGKHGSRDGRLSRNEAVTRKHRGQHEAASPPEPLDQVELPSRRWLELAGADQAAASVESD